MLENVFAATWLWALRLWSFVWSVLLLLLLQSQPFLVHFDEIVFFHLLLKQVILYHCRQSRILLLAFSRWFLLLRPRRGNLHWLCSVMLNGISLCSKQPFNFSLNSFFFIVRFAWLNFLVQFRFFLFFLVFNFERVVSNLIWYKLGLLLAFLALCALLVVQERARNLLHGHWNALLTLCVRREKFILLVLVLLLDVFFENWA